MWVNEKAPKSYSKHGFGVEHQLYILVINLGTFLFLLLCVGGKA